MDTINKKDGPNAGEVGHRHQRFAVAVAKGDFDFRTLKVNDPKATGRQLLEAAGFRPADEHLLFQLLDTGAIEERRLDEMVHLRRKGTERFIAFLGDRSFRVEIDGRRFEWGGSKLNGLTAKQIAGADPACTGVWLERRNETDRFIGDGDIVELDAEGLERLRTGPVFLLWIEDKEFRWSEPTITTEQIAELGGWPPSLGVQEIDRVKGTARTLEPGEVVDLKDLKTFAKKIGWRRG